MTYTTLVGATIEVRETGATNLDVLSNGIKIGTIEPFMMVHYIERGYWKEAITLEWLLAPLTDAELDASYAAMAEEIFA